MKADPKPQFAQDIKSLVEALAEAHASFDRDAGAREAAEQRREEQLLEAYHAQRKRPVAPK